MDEPEVVGAFECLRFALGLAGGATPRSEDVALKAPPSSLTPRYFPLHTQYMGYLSPTAYGVTGATIRLIVTSDYTGRLHLNDITFHIWRPCHFCLWP